MLGTMGNDLVQLGNRNKSVADSPNFRKSAVQIRNSAYPFSPEVTWPRLSFCIKLNLTMCLFTISKCIKIDQPSQEKSGLSKIKVAVNHPVGCENVAGKLRQEW